MDIARRNIKPLYSGNKVDCLNSKSSEQSGSDKISNSENDGFISPCLSGKTSTISKTRVLKKSYKSAVIYSDLSSEKIIETSNSDKEIENNHLLKINSNESNLVEKHSLNNHSEKGLNDQIQVKLKNDRKNFIFKVYSLLCIQLLTTCLFITLTLLVPSLKEGIKKAKPVLILVIILSIVMVIIIISFKKIARKVPYNYAALLIFTLFESYLVSYICTFYEPLLVVLSACLALSVVLSLTIYSILSKTDFTICGGILISFASIMILSLLLMMFFSRFYLNLIFFDIFILIYSAFIVCDTQLIAGGRYEEIGLDDYVIGSLILYVDVIGFFVYLLSMCLTKN